MKLENLESLEQAIIGADMVLVGIGEEWWVTPDEMAENGTYREYYDKLEKQKRIETELPFLMAYYYDLFIPQKLEHAYQNLLSLVKDKNYFIVSTTLDGYLKRLGFNPESVVNPCGNHELLQYYDGDKKRLIPLKEQLPDLKEYLDEVCCEENALQKYWGDDQHSQWEFNNIYAQKYMQSGYEKQWERYLKWLQSTVNRKLVVLELGVGMNFPTVIRWPFEKTVMYNKKSVFFRINESLPMLTPEIAEQGYSCQKNSVDVISTCKNGFISL